MQLTSQAKRVIDLAYDEARQLNSKHIGTEHLLLGLVREEKGMAAQILGELGVDLERTRQVVSELQGTKKTAIDDSLRGRDLLSIKDLSAEEIFEIFKVATDLKNQFTVENRLVNPLLAGKTLAMIFEKQSLRTRVTFEAGMTQLGGHAIYLQPADIALGTRESVPDAARNLERWVQGIMARVFAHQTVVDLAKYANVPVINGLSDAEHPCQALTDFYTILEKKRDLTKVKLAYIGDGCNTCNSLMLLAGKVGTSMTIASPKDYEPDKAMVAAARKYAKETGATISVMNDPYKAVEGANVIYTDTWVSMGLEAEKEERLKVFQPYQVNQALVDAAAEDVIVLHCMPAKRGEEITDEVLGGPKSAAFDEAENRLHVQKAIMALVM
jgi:ornithine carbamoyltransferase